MTDERKIAQYNAEMTEHAILKRRNEELDVENAKLKKKMDYLRESKNVTHK